MRKSFYRYLTKLFKENDRVVILLGDIGVYSFQEAFEHDPKRIYNLGILEQSMIGVAAGLADSGFIPFVHSIAPFITERCIEQIKIDLAHENKGVFIVSVGNSYDYSKLGITHHCPADLSLLNSIPNVEVYCPGNQHDIENIVGNTLYRQCPKYIRLSEYSNDSLVPHSQTILQSGFMDRGTIILVGNAIKDIKRLLAERLHAQIVYVYDLTHFDMRSVPPTNRNIITVVEPGYDCGLISKIATTTRNIEALHSICVPKQFIMNYGSKAELDRSLGLSDEQIISKLEGIYQ